MGVLLSTGLLLGWQQVQSWTGLLLTDYGRTLCLKLALVLAALGFATYNSITARRRAASSSGRAPGWIAAEALLATAVIFAAAVMTGLPPATAAGTAGSSIANEGAAPLALSTTADGWQFDTRVTPGRIGSNVFDVTVTAPNGQNLAGASAALDFAPPGGGAASQLALAQTSPGLFAGTGAMLNQPGAWQLTVSLAPAGGGSGVVTAHYNLDVAVDGVVRAAGTPLPWTVRLVVWLNQYGRAVLALVLVTGAAVWGWIASRTRRGLARLGWLAAGLALAVVLAVTVASA